MRSGYCTKHCTTVDDAKMTNRYIEDASWHQHGIEKRILLFSQTHAILTWHLSRYCAEFAHFTSANMRISCCRVRDANLTISTFLRKSQGNEIKSQALVHKNDHHTKRKSSMQFNMHRHTNMPYTAQITWPCLAGVITHYHKSAWRQPLS